MLNRMFNNLINNLCIRKIYHLKDFNLIKLIYSNLMICQFKEFMINVHKVQESFIQVNYNIIEPEIILNNHSNFLKIYIHNILYSNNNNSHYKINNNKIHPI